MKGGNFSGEGMKFVKECYPDLFNVIKDLDDEVNSGYVLDSKTLKLVSIAISASKCDARIIRKQIKSGIDNYGLTQDEIMDVLKVVLLSSGMPSFVQSAKILSEFYNGD